MTRGAGQPGEPEAERGAYMRLEDNERKKMLTIFAKNLPTYRKNMKLSQEEFGETIGITRQTVKRYLNEWADEYHVENGFVWRDTDV